MLSLCVCMCVSSPSSHTCTLTVPLCSDLIPSDRCLIHRERAEETHMHYMQQKMLVVSEPTRASKGTEDGAVTSVVQPGVIPSGDF